MVWVKHKLVVAALMAAVMGMPAPADDTPVWRCDEARSGAVSEVVPPGLTADWTTTLPGGNVYSSACVAGGRVYVGATDGKVYALSAGDGSTLWTYQAGGAVIATPAYWKGRLYVGCRDGHLYVLNGGTGALLLDIFHGGNQISSPVVADGTLFFCPGAPSRDVRAYDALTGASLWAFDTGQITWSSPAYADGMVFIGNNAGEWYGIDAATGGQVWKYVTEGFVHFASPAVENGVVVLCPGGLDPVGGPYSRRAVHVLNASDGSVIKTVHVKPPAGAVPKAGAGPGPAPAPEEQVDPTSLVMAVELEMLRTMDKASRDAYLDALGSGSGVDYTPLKDWLDAQEGGGGARFAAPGAFDEDLHAESSSPCFFDGKVYITHRELTGSLTDDLYTVAIDTDPLAASDVVWGTTMSTQTLSEVLLVPGPSISAGSWVYGVHGTLLQVRDPVDGTKLDEVDFGVQAIGSPVPANGRVFLTGAGGKVAAYLSGNAPPTLPVAYSPAGGVNLTTGTPPTLMWLGQADAESAVDFLTSELQIGLGYANRDVELSFDAPVAVGAGISSYPMAAVPNNTHVYWRVRIRDPEGAYSAWSAVQDFWVGRDQDQPDPPENVMAVPADGAVVLEWDASPSADVMLYRVWWKQSTDLWSNSVLVDSITGLTHTVTGLANGTWYDFMVVAVDEGENESAGVMVTALPGPGIRDDGGAWYASIQDALNAASPGDTIHVGPGTYVGNLVIPAGVSLRGYSPKHTKILGDGS
ncbi:MAG: PQQ-binding-like beta-propeller repeat protein, partial [Planctomycetota bacterium]